MGCTVCVAANFARTTSRIAAVLAQIAPKRALAECITHPSPRHGAASHLRGYPAAGKPRHQLGPPPGGRRRSRHPAHRHKGTTHTGSVITRAGVNKLERSLHVNISPALLLVSLLLQWKVRSISAFAIIRRHMCPKISTSRGN